MTARHLVLFLRAPALGSGKRRLAGAIGNVAALRFQRRMIGIMARRLGRDRRWRLRIAVTPDIARSRLRRSHPELPRAVPIVPQGGGDLGRRMHRAIAQCPAGPVVLVGADIPALTAAAVWRAFRRLGKCDLVFGPALDGGFWLVGGRRSPAPMPHFGPVRWSSRDALADALCNTSRRRSIGFGDRLEDVDEEAAWRRLAPRRGF